jgi:hypothetical protein
MAFSSQYSFDSSQVSKKALLEPCLLKRQGFAVWKSVGRTVHFSQMRKQLEIQEEQLQPCEASLENGKITP